MKKGTDQTLISKPFKYNELVNYQDGSIVSRTILDHDVGTITVFAFDAEQSLSEHTAPFDALIEVVEGKGNIIIEGKEYEVNSGEQIIMPANRPHAVNAAERFKMVLVMIRAKKTE
ncbi:cupin [Chitinispirillum alkaliphilum]|nr:cupin [Chitinispirillum alkaliphilum]